MTAPRPTGLARALPQPALSVLLFALWALAFNRVTPGVALGGALVAVGVPLGTARFWPEYPRHMRWGAALRLAALVAWDILVANVRVAALVLGPARRLRPAFFVVPLDCDHPYAIAVLAAVVSLTPGTVSADYDRATRALLVHGLDVADPAAAASAIKARYERRIREVYAC